MNSRSTYTPYTYLIGWSDLNLWYYGSRYAKESKCLYETGCHPDDFWVTYHTSSDYVKGLRETHGEPDYRTVDKTFATAEEATDWETKVLKKLPLGDGSPWLNKNDTKGIIQTEEVRQKIRESNTGKKPTEETQRKMSEAAKGRNHTEETKLQMSKDRKGKTPWNAGKKTGPRSEETKRKLSERNRGIKRSEETKRKISESKKGQTSWNKGKKVGTTPTKGRKWWNNGELNKMEKTCPGPGWVQGRIK